MPTSQNAANPTANPPKKVTKAIIPAAGLGTRFLPATKAMPKEMLTVVNKPIIQYAIEEAYEAGIREFIIITGRGKVAMANHFDYPYELADTLKKKGKLVELELVTNTLPSDARIFLTRQGEPLGLGHAVHCAASIIRDEPFAVLLPDDVLCRSHVNGLKEMIQMYETTGNSVVMAEEVPMDRTVNYGILDVAGAKVENSRVSVKSFVEKPKPEDAPSNLAVVGRYVLSPRHMDVLKDIKPGKGGEIQLTDAMVEVAKVEGYSGYVSTAKRFDCGDKVGFQMANLYFAMQDPYIAERLQPFLMETAQAFERRQEPRSKKS